jgi:general secretion pathway protein D
MKVALEVSSIVKEVPGPSNSLAYQIGSRSATTSLRLRDGETQILAGLINDEERMSAGRVPGLGDIPVLGRLFSSQTDSSTKTEIVLLITPRVIRNVLRPENSAPVLASGTEASIGAAPLSIKPGALRGIGGVKAGGGRAAGMDAPAMPAAAEGGIPVVMPEAQPLLLSVPPQAKVGQSVSLALSFNSPLAASGMVELVLDPAFFDSAGTTVTLNGSNGSLRGDAKVALKQGVAAGTAMVEIGTASVVDATGNSLPLTLPAAQSIQLTQ